MNLLMVGEGTAQTSAWPQSRGPVRLLEHTQRQVDDDPGDVGVVNVPVAPGVVVLRLGLPSGPPVCACELRANPIPVT